jgi:ABC-type amino acid transport substrate-binding protein
MTDVPVVTKVAKQFSSTLQSGFSTRLPYTIAAAVQKSDKKLLNGLHAAMLNLQATGKETRFLKKWSLAPSSLAPSKKYTR